MEREEIFNRLRNAVLEYNTSAAVSAAQLVIETKMDPKEAINNGLLPAIKMVGEKFEKMELYLPELITAAEAMQSALDLLLPLIPIEERDTKAVIVVGTVQGDVHDIGKNIVANMLIASGFSVTDLGINVKASAFLEGSRKANAKIICASALMSSTIGSQKDLVDYANALKERGNFKILVGGGPTTQEWAESIGADGYGEDAVDAVKLAEKFSK